jgi:hypothetical protein
VAVTLRRSGRRVARRTVRAATGGTVTMRLRLRRPAGARTGRLNAKARFRQRTTTVR